MKRLISALMITSAFLNPVFAQTAEQEGIDFGRNSIQGTSELVNTNSGQNTVPRYSTDAPESNYFQNGLGNINAVGNNKVNNCLSGQSGTNDQNLECEAINLVNKSATTRPIYSIDPKKDEVIQNSQKITKEAPKNLENGQTCFVKEVKINPVYEEQQCMQGQPFSQAQCIEQTVNDVCPTGFDGNTCNGITGIDRGALTTTGQHNSYITYVGNKLKFGLGYRNSMATGSATTSYKVTIRNRSKLQNIKLLNSVYDDAYLLKINGVEALAVNIGGANDGTTGYASNQELGHFFVEGENTIELTVYNNVNNSPFYADLIIDIPMYCECTKKKTNTCSDEILKNPFCGVQSNVCQEKDWRGNCIVNQQNYVCRDGGTALSDCQQFVNKGCEQIGSVCTGKDASGKCLSYSQKYRCEKTPARIENQTICVQANCIDGKCYQETNEPDGDFGQAIAMMEVAREAGVYGEVDATKTMKVFNGEGGTCTVKLLAGHNIMSCCKEVKVNVDKASNNETNSKQTQAMGNNPDQPAQQTEGSTYQYDDLYNDDSKTMKSLQADLTFGWLECTEEERGLAVKRGGSLCTHAKTWCSKSLPLIGCTEESRSYCCFKSILAKIINREGRKQLGLSLETCEGITVEQLQKLDFSKIDMTEFTESVVPKNIDLGDRAEKIKQRVEKQSVGGYYSE